MEIAIITTSENKKITTLDIGSDILIKNIFNLKSIYNILNRIVFMSYGGTYFNAVISRENCREIAPHTLDELDLKRKLEIGEFRANLKYKETEKRRC